MLFNNISTNKAFIKLNWEQKLNYRDKHIRTLYISHSDTLPMNTFTRYGLMIMNVSANASHLFLKAIIRNHLMLAPIYSQLRVVKFTLMIQLISKEFVRVSLATLTVLWLQELNKTSPRIVAYRVTLEWFPSWKGTPHSLRPKLKKNANFIKQTRIGEATDVGPREQKTKNLSLVKNVPSQIVLMKRNN